MNETPMSDSVDQRLGEFLAWYADTVAGHASTDDAVVGSLLARQRRNTRWSAPGRLRLLGIAAVVAALLAATLAAGQLVGTSRRESVELGPALPVLDLLTEQDRRELIPATYAVHGFRPPFTFSLPAAPADNRWVTCCGGPSSTAVALSEEPAGNLLFVMHLSGASPAEGRYCETGHDVCPGVPLAFVGQGEISLPPVYWIVTIQRSAEAITVLAGSDTQAGLDEFLPRARAVIDSIDFDSTAVTSSPAPGSEPLPPPATRAELFIGSQGFGRELRYVPASQPEAVVTMDEAIAVAAGRFREMLAANSRPPEPAEPIAIVRRMMITTRPMETPSDLRSVWIVAFVTADRGILNATIIDDRTGEDLGGFNVG